MERFSVGHVCVPLAGYSAIGNDLISYQQYYYSSRPPSTGKIAAAASYSPLPLTGIDPEFRSSTSLLQPPVIHKGSFPSGAAIPLPFSLSDSYFWISRLGLFCFSTSIPTRHDSVLQRSSVLSLVPALTRSSGYFIFIPPFDKDQFFFRVIFIFLTKIFVTKTIIYKYIFNLSTP